MSASAAMILFSLPLAGGGGSSPSPCGLQTLAASDGETYASFGWSVALRGDLAAIGAPSQLAHGAAYVFERAAGAWTQTAKLRASDGSFSDEFGWSVAVEADRVLVGARRAGPGPSCCGPGAAYVYERSGSGWSEVAVLAAADAALSDSFGSAVALSGERALVGAPDDDDAGSSSGSAYVFERTPSGWTQIAKLVAADGAMGDQFGAAVALSGDTALIGAHWDDLTGFDNGSAYVFSWTGSSWVQTAKLIPPSGAPAGEFGTAVSLQGERAIVGAPLESGAATSTGAAYVFELQSSLWVQTARLAASVPILFGTFGRSISQDGERALIGSPGVVFGPLPTQNAYVFEHTPSGWVEARRTSLAGDGRYGEDVSLSGDDALVGAPSASGSVFLSGTALAFSASSPPSAQVAASPGALSLSAGGVQSLDAATCVPLGWNLYLWLGTTSGTAPGIAWDALLVPLNPDPYFHFTLGTPNTPPLAASLGLLGGAGTAHATFAIPAGTDPALAGLTLHHSCLGIDRFTFRLLFATDAVPLALVP